MAAPVGSYAQGVVSHTRRSGRVAGRAELSWRGAGIGAGVGSAVGLATVLATRGREVQLRKGTTLDVVFDRPVALE